MSRLEPELWVEDPAAAVAFYRSAFGAVVRHQVGDGHDLVVRLAVDDAGFWLAPVDAAAGRFGPRAIGGRTGRMLLIVDDPDAVHARAVRAGATATSPVTVEHGWRVGRLEDPFGHEWEIGRPCEAPPSAPGTAARPTPPSDRSVGGSVSPPPE